MPVGEIPPVWERDDVSFHEIDSLEGGTRAARLGALWYLINDDGNAISKGYHEIHRWGGGYVGKVGAKIEEVELIDR